MLKLNLDDIQSSIFPGGEVHVQLDTTLNYKEVELTANINNSEKAMKLFLVLDALMRINPDGDVYLILPYLPYARQDRVCAPGQAFSLDLFSRLLGESNENLSSITVLDPHSGAIQKLVYEHNIAGLTVDCLDLLDVLPANIQFDVVIAPDKGAYNRAQEVAEAYEVPLVQADKVRDPFTGSITEYQLLNNPFVKDKTVLVVDDICDGGATFCLLGEELKKKGVKKAILFVSHGIFSRGLDELKKYYDEIYCANNIWGNVDLGVKQ